LVETLQQVFDEPVPAPTQASVHFDTNQADLLFNSKLLEHYDYDFERFLSSQSGSTLDFGSEFRPLAQLEKVLGTHPNLYELAEVVTSGMPYRFLHDLSEDERSTELLAMISRGNHKSAEAEPAAVTRLLYKDVTHMAFQCPSSPPLSPRSKRRFSNHSDSPNRRP
jgi:hypothetical protein